MYLIETNCLIIAQKQQNATKEKFIKIGSYQRKLLQVLSRFKKMYIIQHGSTGFNKSNRILKFATIRTTFFNIQDQIFIMANKFTNDFF